jgi:hypothetical protein
MKNKILIIFTSLLMASVISCTNDFDEINTRPDALTASDISAKFLVTDVQQKLIAQNTFGVWLGNMLHPDLFSGQSAQGFAQSDWTGESGWSYNDFWQYFTYLVFAEYNATLTSYMGLVEEGGSLENNQFYAFGLIMKGLYYQQIADTYGAHPYSEASNPEISQPVFDNVKDIYKGIIADLDQAISIIGNSETTGSGVEQLAENDVVFNGDMQKWKQLANSLKLRLALRAHGAQGDDFSAAAASEAITSGVLANANALFERDQEINQWAGGAVYGDILSGFPTSNWAVAEPLVNILRDNNDPRLNKIAKPSVGGVITITKPIQGDAVALISEHVAFLKSTLDLAGAEYTLEETSSEVIITMPENTNYVGLPNRLSPKIKPYFNGDLFSFPQDIIVQQKGQGKPIYPAVIMSAADSHFMIAEAIVKGLASGDANSFYQTGIEKAMDLWDGVDSNDLAAYLASDMGQLIGSDEQKLEKIATQRWIANYANGYEAWAIVRDTGYPTSAYSTVTASESNIKALGSPLNGAYPQRLRYNSDVYGTNQANVEASNAIQGPDVMATKLWWAKN